MSAGASRVQYKRLKNRNAIHGALHAPKYLREINMLPELIGRGNAHENTVADAMQFSLKTDSPLQVMHVLHLPCFREVALGATCPVPARASER
jgi:hypothetical protein